jgi:hypothetical protein
MKFTWVHAAGLLASACIAGTVIIAFRTSGEVGYVQINTVPVAPLPHRRDDELGAFLSAGRPARGHRLGFGVEADRVGAVLVEVTEA